MDESLQQTRVATDRVSVDGTADGISLLALKNQTTAAYLHFLCYVILWKLNDHSLAEERGQELVKRLVELRVTMERGIRPLEAKLAYQIKKLLRLASEESMPAELSFKANPLSFSNDRDKGDHQNGRNNDEDNDLDDDGRRRDVYRPPRIAATLPTEERERERQQRPRRTNRAVEDFIGEEFSTAPVAEPSVGATVAMGGRSIRTPKDRQVEQRRREYEEANMIRLPRPSKKELARQRKEQGGFGGEDWNTFAGEFNDLVPEKSSVAERSRKRSLPTSSSSTAQAGKRFEKRKKMLKR